VLFCTVNNGNKQPGSGLSICNCTRLKLCSAPLFRSSITNYCTTLHQTCQVQNFRPAFLQPKNCLIAPVLCQSPAVDHCSQRGLSFNEPGDLSGLSTYSSNLSNSSNTARRMKYSPNPLQSDSRYRTQIAESCEEYGRQSRATRAAGECSTEYINTATFWVQETGPDLLINRWVGRSWPFNRHAFINLDIIFFVCHFCKTACLSESPK
jgi:hypothetical protein